MQLKNKTQREEFLNNYRAWELWKEIPELELKLYRKVLPNGTVIIATEHACMKFACWTKTEAKYKKSISVKYHLLLSDKDNYKIQYEEYAYWTQENGFEGCMLEDGLKRPPQSWCYVESEVM